MIKTIRVELLKGLSVWADGTPVLESSAKINKPWQVFAYLILNRDAPASTQQLVESIWAEEDLTDPANVLKNTVYALRREFKQATSQKESPILFENGGYICDPNISYEVDAEIFEKTYLQSQGAQGKDRLRLLGVASGMYRGDLLPQLGEAVWVVTQSVRYHELYVKCAAELLETLYENEQHSELLTEATAASQVDPYEEKYYLYIFRALYAMGMYRVIVPTYQKTVRIFTEQLGTTLGPEIREIYAEAMQQINQIEQDVMIIKEDLQEANTEDASRVKGPLYCTYDVFKYLYQMVARSNQRIRHRILILLLSVQMEDGSQPPAQELSGGMNHIKNAILGGLLRRSDTMARYSNSQYIIMLSSEHTSGADTVMARLRKKFEPYLEQRGMKIVFAMAELEALP